MEKKKAKTTRKRKPIVTTPKVIELPTSTKIPAKRKSKSTTLKKGIKIPKIDVSLLQYSSGELDPFVIYNKFYNSHKSNKTSSDSKYITDAEIGQSLIATQGYIAPIAMKFGVSVGGLKNRIDRTPHLKSMYQAIKSMHIDSVERSLFNAALNGEGWAVRFIMTSKDAQDRGYSANQDDEKAAIDINILLRKRLDSMEAKTEIPYKTNDEYLDKKIIEVEAKQKEEDEWGTKGFTVLN